MASDLITRGQIVYGNVSSADASTAVEITLYDRDGNTISMPSDKRLAVVDINVTAGANDVAVFFSSTEAAGKAILDSEKDAALASFNVPRVGPVGEAPHVKTGTATSTRVQLHGYLVN